VLPRRDDLAAVQVEQDDAAVVARGGEELRVVIKRERVN
jgi:hypothetical protein